MGPRACSRSVLIPISAPKPNSNPSLNLVLAFQNTAALSTEAMKRSAAALSDVTIASLWAEPSRLMVATASSSEPDDADGDDEVQEFRGIVGGSGRRAGDTRP